MKFKIKYLKIKLYFLGNSCLQVKSVKAFIIWTMEYKSFVK